MTGGFADGDVRVVAADIIGLQQFVLDMRFFLVLTGEFSSANTDV